MHKSSSVVASRSIGKSKHGLGQFSVELGVGVAQSGFNVDEFLDVVEGSVHLNNRDITSVVVFLGVLELHARLRAGELGGSRGPLDGGALVEEVARVEVGNTVLLDATDTKGLLVFLVELGREDLNDKVSILLLGVNVGIKVGLTGLDGSQDGLEGVSTLLHVTLDLPVKLDLRGDIKVESEVEEVTDTLVVHGVETLEDDDGGRLNGLGGVKGSVDVVVDWLLNGLALLQSLNLLVHKVEVVLDRVKSSESRDLTSLTVVKMVIIEADDGGEVRNKGVSLPSSVSESSSERSNNITSKDGSQTAHEGGLSATRVSGNTDDNGGLSLLKSIELGALDRRGRTEGNRGEGGNASGTEGEDGSKLHLDCSMRKL